MALEGIISRFKTKKHDRTLDPKYRKVDLYGEMGMRKFRDFISQRREGLGRPDLLTLVRALSQFYDKKESSRNVLKGQSHFFNFCENYYVYQPRTHARFAH